MHKPILIAEQFAKALDQEDYAAAAALLANDCEYSCRGEYYYGPAEIVASYQANGDMGKSLFDAIKYESKVIPGSDNSIRIQFADQLEHAARQFTFRCEQIVKINESGKIVRIEHVDLPGQREALAEFKNTLAYDT